MKANNGQETSSKVTKQQKDDEAKENAEIRRLRMLINSPGFWFKLEAANKIVAKSKK